jgi:hypothetical protein
MKYPNTHDIVGDLLTLFGAYWTAGALWLAPEQAAGIVLGTWDKEPLKDALLKQSNDAKAGLVCVAVGAGFQIVSKLIEEFPFVSKPSKALGRMGFGRGLGSDD